MPGPSNTLRVFASKPFLRFARRFGISDAELWQAVQEDCDADLGGGVFKFRLARLGEGTSGGARANVAMKVGLRVVLMYGTSPSKSCCATSPLPSSPTASSTGS